MLYCCIEDLHTSLNRTLLEVVKSFLVLQYLKTQQSVNMEKQQKKKKRPRVEQVLLLNSTLSMFGRFD